MGKNNNRKKKKKENCKVIKFHLRLASNDKFHALTI